LRRGVQANTRIRQAARLAPRALPAKRRLQVGVCLCRGAGLFVAHVYSCRAEAKEGASGNCLCLPLAQTMWCSCQGDNAVRRGAVRVNIFEKADACMHTRCQCGNGVHMCTCSASSRRDMIGQQGVCSAFTRCSSTRPSCATRLPSHTILRTRQGCLLQWPTTTLVSERDPLCDKCIGAEAELTS